MALSPEQREARAKALRGAIVDVSILSGVALTSYGAGLIFVPAGLITLGILLLGFGLTAARSR